MTWIKTLLKIAAALFIVGLLCLIPAYLIVFKYLPKQDPDGIFNRRYILSELSGESRVSYRDAFSDHFLT